VKGKDRLALYVDGKLEAESAALDSADYNLTSSAPLSIGFGPNDYFRGRMADLRIYRRPLTVSEVNVLAGVAD
jgi:hypothetical protein